MFTRITRRWSSFEAAKPTLAQLIIFMILNVGMTVLQLILMPVIKMLFESTPLVETGFQALPIGAPTETGQYYVFDYAAGALPDGGGGLAYFLAVQITLAIAQVINFFAQRNITFKSNSNPWVAAVWYALAYVVITFGAAALQGFYKAPIYDLFITTWGMGATGEAAADMVTMLINALLSAAVYFPIFKIIFRREPEIGTTADAADERDRIPA
ncbi:hypothetical protein LQ938_13360 [Microbacterium sp. cx-55]|uniref:hypothetical protein n=1 Tax=unclassified Microbacterium TaxID=2609290 RepID=UPI001CBCCA73|nr:MULTISPECIES: hypothetical protein [unclassified Microbacterium]MBZ4487746.1 hypothetical protein [Microbacterium sp. cx-55]MCC4909238.1 hypothetical protein [Microbacterium sp. cx-59]UGB34842.1 hypothetical protein LQ938_13360 [Microbacterium sp. cx-55]